MKQERNFKKFCLHKVSVEKEKMLSRKKGFTMKNIHSRADAMREMKPKGDTRPNLKGTKKSGKKDDVSMVAKTETGTEIKIRRNQVL